EAAADVRLRIAGDWDRGDVAPGKAPGSAVEHGQPVAAVANAVINHADVVAFVAEEMTGEPARDAGVNSVGPDSGEGVLPNDAAVGTCRGQRRRAVVRLATVKD